MTGFARYLRDVAIAGLAIGAGACGAAGTPPNQASGQTADCAGSAMAVTPLDLDAAKSSLRFPGGDAKRFTMEYAYAYRGRCAAVLQGVVGGIVRLNDGNTFHVPDKGGPLAPWPRGKGLFVAEDLEPGDIPAFGKRRLIDASDYMSVQTKAGMEHRYVGLWSDGKLWTVATFVTPAKGAAPKPLFHSTLPLRGLAFFPSPDTNSGQIWLVQDGLPDETRVRVVSWWHERAADSAR